MSTGLQSVSTSISANQLEFLAEDEPITVIPNFKLPVLHFIRGSIGPLHPAVPATVPLWLALLLKKQRKCKIQIPEWMDPDSLQAILDAEIKDRQYLQDLPFHYMEIATLLLDQALDDVRNPSKVRPLLEQIWNKRAGKLRELLLTLNEDIAFFNFNSASGMEINKMRPFIAQALTYYYKLKQENEERGGI